MENQYLRSFLQNQVKQKSRDGVKGDFQALAVPTLTVGTTRGWSP